MLEKSELKDKLEQTKRIFVPSVKQRFQNRFEGNKQGQ